MTNGIFAPFSNNLFHDKNQDELSQPQPTDVSSAIVHMYQVKHNMI